MIANTNTYQWNARNQLTQISQGSTVEMSYAYDALGRRIAKTTQGGTPTQFLYDGAKAVQETQGSAINPILIGPGVDERYARNDVTGRTYFLADAIGNTIGLTDTTGAIREKYSYDLYGNVTPSDTTTGFTNPYQFMGREADTAGLYYYRARYYSPMMAGFISEDPIRFGGGQLSFYAGFRGDPLDYTDPYGLFWTPGDPLPQGFVNGVAGFGDGVYSAITFGYGDLGDVRELLGSNDVVDRCSGIYNISSEFGNGVGTIALSGAGLTKVAQIANVRSTAQAAMLSLQLMSGASDLTGYVTEGASLMEQLSALVDMQQESAFEEGLELVK